MGDPVYVRATLYAWTFEWVLEFSATRYIRVWEQYGRVPGLQESRRVRFAFHYGPITGRDGSGNIVHAFGDPVDIRVDDFNSPAHLHFQGPKPHYYQESVLGLELSNLDMIAFIKAVLRHRKSGKPLDKILKFRIR